MATRTQVINNVLDRLRRALGTGETPPGSNHNFITVWYNENVSKIGNGAWCEMTVTYAMWTGGAKTLKTGRAYTVWAAEDAVAGRQNSSWHWGTEGMRPGDQPYYDWNGKKGSTSIVDHTGMVEKDNGNGTWYILEGNLGNKLVRVLRDSRYIVGYTRFDWDSLISEESGPVNNNSPMPHGKPKPKPPVKRPTPDRHKTAAIQRLLEVEDDGQWGAVTDDPARRMHAAARAYAGWPKKVPAKFNVFAVQRVIDTYADGDWGHNSQEALERWISQMQQVLGVKVDGVWGPSTDNAFLTARATNLNNF